MDRQARILGTMALLGAVLVGLGWLIGGDALVGWALALGILWSLLLGLASPWLIRLALQARPIMPEAAPELHAANVVLASRAGLPRAPALYVLETRVPTAMATGFTAAQATVIFTRGLLDGLAPPQVEAVLAHEIAHIRHGDIQTMSVAGGVALSTQGVARLAVLFGDRQAAPFGRIGMLLGVVLAPLLALRLVASVSRVAEYRADATAAALTGDPLALADALGWLDEFKASGGTAALSLLRGLCTIDPLEPGWFATHPPVAERRRRLIAMAQRSEGANTGGMMGLESTNSPGGVR